MPATSMNRRRFLQGLAAMPLSGLLPLTFSGSAEAAGMRNRVLLVVHLDGGCDGLNTVIPFADPAYAAARPSLAIPASSVLKLSDTLGLHPAMTGLKTWFDSGRVAIVNGVGYVGFNRSHFAAEDIFWMASTDSSPPSTGWLGRTLDYFAVEEPLAGICLGSTVPKSMAAESFATPAIPAAERYLYQTPGNGAESARQIDAVNALFNQPASGKQMLDALLAQDRSAAATVDQVQRAVSGYQSGVPYGGDSFSQSMKLAAQLIHADLGVQVISTAFGSFDTHANEANTLQTLLGSLSDGVDKFMQDAAAGGFADRVAILVWTEFGRRVAENASAGTDHGTAAPMFLIGEGVRGGLYGAYPSLTDLDAGDLKMSVDFRSVYASSLSQWLNADDRAILGADWGTLPLFV